MFDEKYFDLESFLNDFCDRPDPKTFDINHVFYMKRELKHIVYCQEFHGKEESKHNYKKENAYRGEQRKIIIRNIFKHLKQL